MRYKTIRAKVILRIGLRLHIRYASYKY